MGEGEKGGRRCGNSTWKNQRVLSWWYHETCSMMGKLDNGEMRLSCCGEKRVGSFGTGAIMTGHESQNDFGDRRFLPAPHLTTIAINTINNPPSEVLFTFTTTAHSIPHPFYGLFPPSLLQALLLPSFLGLGVLPKLLQPSPVAMQNARTGPQPLSVGDALLYLDQVCQGFFITIPPLEPRARIKNPW